MGEEKLALNYQIGSYTPARTEKTATLTKCSAVHFSLAILTTCRQRRGPSYLENRQHGGCYAALLLVRDVPIRMHYLKVMHGPVPPAASTKSDRSNTQFPATDAPPSTSTCGDNAEWPATDVLLSTRAQQLDKTANTEHHGAQAARLSSPLHGSANYPAPPPSIQEECLAKNKGDPRRHCPLPNC